MPQLERTSGEHLLKSLNRPHASSSSRSSPSSVPKPAPTQDDINAEPKSPSSEGSSDGADPPSPPAKTSPYQLPKGRTAFAAPRRQGGSNNGKRTRGDVGGTAAVRGTQDSGVGLSDLNTKAGEGEDMGIFGDMGAPSKKTRKTTSYTDFSRSIEAGKVKKGYGSGAGAKSAQSTPRSKLAKDAATATRVSTGSAKAAADKKGTPFSTISVNATTWSADRLPGKSPSCGSEKRSGGGQLKTLDEIELPSPSPKKVVKIQILDEIEPPAPNVAPKLQILDSIKPQSPVQKENVPQLKLLDDIGPSRLHSKGTSRKKIGVKKRAQGGLHSPPQHSRRGKTTSESSDCEIIDMSTILEQNRLRKNKSGIKKPKPVEAPSPSKAKVPELKMLDEIDPPTSSNSSTKPSGQRRSKRRRKNKGVSAAGTSGPRSPSPGGSDPSGLSSPPSSSVLDDEADTVNPAGNYEQPALCPICRAPVDRLLLEEWQGSKLYMRISKQIAFCEAHRRATAAEEYAAREYPTVAFEALPARVERFRAALVEVVRKERPSAFRDAAEEAAAMGRGRNMLATSRQDEGLKGMSVGYYGPRGRRAMETWVTARLADEIREATGRDRLIGYKSVSGFIQEVLVPELAMRLVAEDLDVEEARAREVLAESGEIGELVNGLDEEEGGEKDGGGERVVVDDDSGDY